MTRPAWQPGLRPSATRRCEYIGEGTAGRAGTLSRDTADGAPQNLQVVEQEQSLTTPWVRKVQADAANVGSGYPAQVQAERPEYRRPG